MYYYVIVYDIIIYVLLILKEKKIKEVKFVLMG